MMQARKNTKSCRPGNHDAIVGAERRRWEEDARSAFFCCLKKPPAHFFVCTYTSRHDQLGMPRLVKGGHGLLAKQLNNGSLHFGGQVGPCLARLGIGLQKSLRAPKLLNLSKHSGFQASKTQVKPLPFQKRPRQTEPSGNTAFCKPGNGGASRVAKPKQLS
jgi:hypothetical protein